ncbi:MAG: hypothetical protein MI974_01345, partial [Chitinophagales bacterium]|nr:hypothetical protein [Chitinophagales bacterium]
MQFTTRVLTKPSYLFIRELLVVFLFVFVGSNVFAQPVNNLIGDVTMPTPNAAALGKYTDIPVSYYTGVPNISIPIHTVKEGPLSLPVSLSYHASGIKVGEPASWVGLGWSLSAGGMIARTVQGIEDEGLGVGNGNGYLESPPASHPQCGSANGTEPDFYHQIGDGHQDGEPDIFSFNFAGYSGKFYFNSSGEYVLIPKQDILIEYEMNGSGEDELYQFILTTPDGVKYYFGTTSEDNFLAIDRTKIASLSLAGPSAWYLRKVESHDGLHEIVLYYNEDIPVNNGFNGYEYYGYKNLRQRNSVEGATPPISGANPFFTQFYATGSRLTSIRTSSNLETVTFTPQNTDREDLGVHYANGSSKNVKALDEISIASGNYCKKFKFRYDYFEDKKLPSQFGTEENKRLQLLSVQELSCDKSIEIPAYTFDYEEQFVGGESYLPNRLSKAIDHWGFYNGAYGNNATFTTYEYNIPPIENYYEVNIGAASVAPGQLNQSVALDANGDALFHYSYGGKSDRESNENSMQLGILKQINYPTGGYHKFEYEANTYYDIEGINENELINLGDVSWPCVSAATDVSSRHSESFVIYSQDYLSRMKYSMTKNLSNTYQNPATCAGGNDTDVVLEKLNNGTYEFVAHTSFLAASPDVLFGRFENLFNLDPNTDIDYGETYRISIYEDLPPGGSPLDYGDGTNYTPLEIVTYYLDGLGPEDLEDVTDISLPCSSIPTDIYSSIFQIPDAEFLANLRYSLDVNLQPTNSSCDGSLSTTITLVKVVSNGVYELVSQAEWDEYSLDVFLGSFVDLFDIDNEDQDPVNDIDYGSSYRLIIYNPVTNNFKTPLSFNLYEVAYPGVNVMAGGLRIKKISANDGTSETMVRTYEYTDKLDESRSSGQLYNKPKYDFAFAHTIDAEPYCQKAPHLWDNSTMANFVNIFFEHSVVPLSSFEGHHLGYKRVIEKIEDNGSTEFQFYSEYSPNYIALEDDFDQYDYHPGQGIEFPLAPSKARIDAGNLHKKMVRDENGNLKSVELNVKYPDPYEESNGEVDVMIKTGLYSWNAYTLRTKPYRLEKIIYNLDNVEKTTSFEYASSDHLQATKKSFNNSDGTIYSTEYKYAHEMLAANEMDAQCLLDRWMINVPMEVKEYAGGTVIGGNRTFYTNCYPTSNEEILLNDARVSRGLTSGYTNGYPNDFTYMSFPTETYNWLNGGRLNTRDFEAWNWDYDYHLNTRMTSKIKNIDGQDVDYEYDQLGRLNKIIARDGNVTTDIVYQIGGGNNKVTTTTTFTDDTPTQITSEEFDGLGRMTKQTVNGIAKQEIIYDEAGRVGKDTYLPGSFTTYKYEPSPLNRVQRAIFPDLNYIETYYGGESNYYKVTTRNERGYRSSALTDILGRQYKYIDAEEGETVYDYDERSNLEYVYPPSGSPYTYTYDTRNRMTSKLVPGSKIQIFRYDDATDLMEYSIDANGNRMDYVYDVYGREKEVKHNELGNWDPDDPNYYNNVANHGSPGSMVMENTYGENNGSQINTGKLVATKAKILKSGPTSYAQTLFTYDTYGRVSQQKDFHHLGTDYYNFTNNLADWVLEERRTHTKAGNQMELITKRGYDNFGRELFYNTRVDGADALLAIGRSYNEKDQVVGKYYAGLDPFSALDYAKYKYNVRGWLTNINDVVYDLQEADECGELFDTGGDIIQVEQEVDVDGLLDWLCEEPDGTTIDGTDPCTPGDCFDEYYDYVVYSQHTASLTPDGYYVRVKLSSITLQGGDEVPLPNYPYYYDSQTSMNTLESDLEDWLDDNNYAYDDVIVSSTFHEIGTSGKYYHSFVLQILGVIDDVVFEDIEETYRYTNDLSSDPIPFYAHFNHGVPCNDHVPTENTKPQSASLLDIRQQIISTNPATLTFPVIAYQTHIEDGTSRWIPKDALPLLTGSYVRGKRIHISNPLEILEARYENGTHANLNLLALYQELAGDLGMDIKDMEDESEEEECDEPSFSCTPEQQASQQESLAGIQNSICNMSASDFEFPLTVTFVQLCDGTTGYIPGEELLSELEGPYYILNQFDIDADDLITILVTIKRPLFAMHFSKYQENGNIAELRWKVTDRSVKQYNFTYDGIDRLTSANYGYYTVVSTPQGELRPDLVPSEEYSVPSISYNPIGNITDLIRNGMVPGTTCLEPNEIDNLSYSYNPMGQLEGVDDSAPLGPRSYGFVPGSTATIQYQYDDNGNMTHDA